MLPDMSTLDNLSRYHDASDMRGPKGNTTKICGQTNVVDLARSEHELHGVTGRPVTQTREVRHPGFPEHQDGRVETLSLIVTEVEGGRSRHRYSRQYG